MKLRLALGACLPLALTACGGSDGPEQKDIQPLPEIVYEFSSGDLDVEPSMAGAIPAGVYQFTMQSSAPDPDAPEPDPDATEPDLSGEDKAGVAIISPSGRITYVTTNENAVARIKVTAGEQFNAELQSTAERGYYGLAEDEQAAEGQTWQIKGGRDRLEEAGAAKISGTIIDTVDGSLIDIFRMVRNNDISDELIDLNSTAATYRDSADSGITTTLTVAADGGLAGSDTTGCQYTGTVLTPDPGVNVLEAKYEVSSCGPNTNISADKRNGKFYALGYVNTDEHKLTLFGSSDAIAIRFTGTDIDTPPPETPQEIDFVGSNLETNSQVESTFNPGIYSFAEIVIPVPAPVPDADPDADPDAGAEATESGFAILSPTGRLAINTDKRFIYSQIRVSETLTFTADSYDYERDPDNAAENPAATIFGAPEIGNTPFSIVGSLIAEDGTLANRYRLTREEALSAENNTPSSLAGSYTSQWSAGITTTVTMGSEGTFSGSDTTGCNYNGEFIVPDQTLNIIEARFEATGCTASFSATGEERNGTYNALGMIHDGSLRLMMTNGNYSFGFEENL